MPIPRLCLAVLALASLSACVAPSLAGLSSMAGLMARDQPAMRWDHRDEGPAWTKSTLLAVASRDDVLATQTPADIGDWCPGYLDASLPERRAFWAGLLSALAKYESQWNPAASGGGGRYIGLMQISPQTARSQGCAATSGAALKNGSANLACAVEIMASQVGRDKMVSGNGNRGIGRDWGPVKSASNRSEMSAWTASQAYCQ
jgi:hypothetical protein